jgi:hypothetical protein
MKSIVELLNELKRMDESTFARRFALTTFASAYSRRIDFDNWLQMRRAGTQVRRYR